MSKQIALTLAATLLTASTVLTSDAQARGGHGLGGHGLGGRLFGGGAAARVFTPKVFTPKLHVMKIQPKVTSRVLLHKPQILKVKPILTPTLHARPLLAPKLAKLPLGLHGPQMPHLGLKSKLTTQHYQSAKIKDGNGHMYVASKKMWFDGKHWWKGYWAWLFINGVWYYGDTPWTASGDTWTTAETRYLPECVNCGGKKAVVTALAPKKVRPECLAKSTTIDAPPSPAQVGTTAPTPGEEQPAQPVDGTETAAAATQGCKLVTDKEVGIDGGATPAGTAEAETTPRRIAAIGTVEPAPAPAPAATECRQFVPAIGMTIDVPCGN